MPVVRGWLRDEIEDWGGVLEALGGVHVVTETRDPDADLGPVLARTDAPPLFAAVDEVARRLGVQAAGPDPADVPALLRGGRLGPVAGPDPGAAAAAGADPGRAPGDPRARAGPPGPGRRDPRGAVGPVRRGAAARRSTRPGDRRARAARGLGADLPPLVVAADRRRSPGARRPAPTARPPPSPAAARRPRPWSRSPLVQPLFREVLEHYDPTDPEAPNLYAFFRAFWYRLPPEVHTAMRLQLLANGAATDDPAHPPLPDRLALLQSYPDPASHASADAAPATTTLGDLEVLEQMLHNRLFALPTVEPSVFHRNRAWI